MKNLAVFTIILFSASICHAQLSHDSDREIHIKDKVAKSESEEAVLFIPMLGNVTIKNSNYAFKKAIMPFQIEDLKISGHAIKEDSILSIEAKPGEILTAETEVNKE